MQGGDVSITQEHIQQLQPQQLLELWRQQPQQVLRLLQQPECSLQLAQLLPLLLAARQQRLNETDTAAHAARGSLGRKEGFSQPDHSHTLTLSHVDPENV